MIIIKIIIRDLLIEFPVDPRRQRSKWPAIMLAVNRIARVKGRINKLIDSIITMNGIRINGVPCGVRWDIRSLKKLNRL